MQTPAEQVWPVVHWCPHMPQFPTLVAVSTQRPLHAVCPLGQPHAPMLHAWPPVHALPQNPQLSGSLLMFAQLLSHAIKPAAHDAEQTPCEQ
jgi:hypothetical protein